MTIDTGFFTPGSDSVEAAWEARLRELGVTYEAHHYEPPHPDRDVVARLREWSIGPCGCKVYADPCSRVRILAHNAVYGCRR